MYVIATNMFQTKEEAQEELTECYGEGYRVYEVKESKSKKSISREKAKQAKEIKKAEEAGYYCYSCPIQGHWGIPLSYHNKICKNKTIC